MMMKLVEGSIRNRMSEKVETQVESTPSEPVAPSPVETSDQKVDTPSEAKSDAPATQENKEAESNGPPKKYPLQSRWTFWFSKTTKGTSDATRYEENLDKLGSFDSIDEFWNYYSHLMRPNELTKNSNIYLFRNDAAPMWESFPKGGCWNLHISKSSQRLSRFWEQLVFAAIGETFEDPAVVGVAVSIRSRENVLSVWIDENNANVRFNVGEKVKEILQLSPTTTIEYKNHSSSIKDRSTYRNGKLYVVST